MKRLNKSEKLIESEMLMINCRMTRSKKNEMKKKKALRMMNQNSWIIESCTNLSENKEIQLYIDMLKYNDMCELR